MYRIFICFICLISINVFSVEHIQVGCSIYDIQGQLIKKINGLNCAYLNDGSTLVVEHSEVVLYDRFMHSKWSYPGFFHHQLNVDQDSNQVALIDAYSRPFLNCEKTRFDRIILLDLKTGKLISKVEIFDYKDIFLSNFKSKSDLRHSDFQIFQFKYKCDTTHVNSIHKIKFKGKHTSIPALEKGNWLVNISFQNIIAVFDSQLKKLLWYQNLGLKSARFHDVQYQEDGSLLIYHNDYYKENNKKYSEVIKFDPLKLKVIQEYNIKNQNQRFYKDKTGGVQITEDGRMLVSVFNHKKGDELVLLDKKKNILLQFAPNYNSSNKFGDRFQEGKLIDLSSYLKNNQSGF